MRSLKFFLILPLLSPFAFGLSQKALQENQAYERYLSHSLSSLWSTELLLNTDLYLDALWEKAFPASPEGNAEVQSFENTYGRGLSTDQRFRLNLLKHVLGLPIPASYQYSETVFLQKKPLVYILWAYQKEIRHPLFLDLLQSTSRFYFDEYQIFTRLKEEFSPRGQNELKELVEYTPKNLPADSLQLFLFCRHSRELPCLFVMKNKDGEIHTDQTGGIWSLPALALARRSVPFYQRNGYTPQGVHLIDGVMPETNNPRAYGNFRRVILDWVPSSRGEQEHSSFLPPSSFENIWWQEGVMARNAGRRFLRIHGTGLRNEDRLSSWYPHVWTSGCISTKEGQYENEVYTDQRLLLDEMMKAQGLAPVFGNEPKLRGVLYVVEINDELAPVTLQDLPFL